MQGIRVGRGRCTPQDTHTHAVGEHSQGSTVGVPCENLENPCFSGLGLHVQISILPIFSVPLSLFLLFFVSLDLFKCRKLSPSLIRMERQRVSVSFLAGVCAL